jgi:hypothetical protein
MRKQGKPSDHWIDEFYYWLEAQSLTARKNRDVLEADRRLHGKAQAWKS